MDDELIELAIKNIDYCFGIQIPNENTVLYSSKIMKRIQIYKKVTRLGEPVFTRVGSVGKHDVTDEIKRALIIQNPNITQRELDYVEINIPDSLRLLIELEI